ncbi:hypothetical protein M8494_35455 [Serratia ureilytica]
MLNPYAPCAAASCLIRETGNAGSFFKNPLVSAEKAAELIAKYPGMPHYHSRMAGEACGRMAYRSMRTEGYRIGGAAVHRQQALVLVNIDNAHSQGCGGVMRHVRKTVADKFVCGWNLRCVLLARPVS